MQFFLKFKNNNAKMTYLEVAKAALESATTPLGYQQN